MYPIIGRLIGSYIVGILLVVIFYLGFELLFSLGAWDFMWLYNHLEEKVYFRWAMVALQLVFTIWTFFITKEEKSGKSE